MEVLTTGIQELTERLLQQSERQAALLAALKEFRTPSPSDAPQLADVRASGICVDDPPSAVTPSADPIDGVDELEALWQMPGSYDEPVVTDDDVTTVRANSGSAVVERDAHTSPDEPVLVDVPPETMPAGAPGTSASGASVGTATPAAPGRAAATPVARGLPRSSNGRPSGSPSRQRRDYNYFADLEAKLSKLEGDGGATRT
jgi:hypothetical protein